MNCIPAARPDANPKLVEEFQNIGDLVGIDSMLWITKLRTRIGSTVVGELLDPTAPV